MGRFTTNSRLKFRYTQTTYGLTFIFYFPDAKITDISDLIGYCLRHCVYGCFGLIDPPLGGVQIHVGGLQRVNGALPKELVLIPNKTPTMVRFWTGKPRPFPRRGKRTCPLGVGA